jgi:hypothetical protein
VWELVLQQGPPLSPVHIDHLQDGRGKHGSGLAGVTPKSTSFQPAQGLSCPMRQVQLPGASAAPAPCQILKDVNGSWRASFIMAPHPWLT